MTQAAGARGPSTKEQLSFSNLQCCASPVRLTAPCSDARNQGFQSTTEPTVVVADHGVPGRAVVVVGARRVENAWHSFASSFFIRRVLCPIGERNARPR
jgi:hypothetical protein